MTHRFLFLLGLFAGCAAVHPDPPPLPILAEPPARAHRTLERIEVSGRINEPLEGVYQTLRRRAHEAGADALVVLRESRRVDPALPPGEDDDAIGEAHPELLDGPFRPGFFPYEGSGVRTVGGYFWEVAALAVAYEDRPASGDLP